jgi:hypothetical protein
MEGPVDKHARRVARVRDLIKSADLSLIRSEKALAETRKLIAQAKAIRESFRRSNDKSSPKHP